MDYISFFLQTLSGFPVGTRNTVSNSALFNFGKLLEPESMTGLPVGLVIIIPLLSFLVLFFYMEACRNRWTQEGAHKDRAAIPAQKNLSKGHLILTDLSEEMPRERELKLCITTCRAHARWYPVVLMGGGLCLLSSLSSFAAKSVIWMDYAMLMAGISALMWFSRSFQERRKKRRTIDRLRRELAEETGYVYPKL